MYSDQIERAFEAKEFKLLLSYCKRLKDNDLKGMASHHLSMLGVGAAILDKPRIALRPLWFAFNNNSEDTNCRLNLGNCLKDLEDYRGALDIYLGAPEATRDPLILLGAGICFLELSAWSEAAQYLEQALEIDPLNKVTLLNLGRAYYRLEKVGEAIELYKRALEIDKTYGHAAVNLSICAIKSTQFSMGVALAEQVFESGYWSDEYLRTIMSEAIQGGAPKLAIHLFEEYGRRASSQTRFVAAEMYRLLKDLVNAEKLCRDVIKKEKGFFSAGIILQHTLAEQGKIGDADKLAKAAFLRHDLSAIESRFIPNPWTIFSVSDSPSIQLKVASRYAKAAIDVRKRDSKSTSKSAGKRSSERRVIAYFSPDFRAHPVTECLLPILRAHDRERYEIHAFSLGATEDAYTEEVKKNVDKFHNCYGQSYEEVKSLCEEFGVQVAVDLAVYTSSSRPTYFACGLAPLQVNFLGYSGTSGSAGYDIIVGDSYISPASEHKFYSEKVVELELPVISCGVRDFLDLEAQSRESNGLNGCGDAFVFGCLANPYKFSGDLLRCWARILARVPGSVFLLGNMSQEAFKNVQGEFRKEGISAERIVQSPFQKTKEDHIARLKVIDLFLDTHPYNAHSLAADAVSAGVPVVTLTGKSFASRVAASLNWHFGQERLIAKTVGEYEEVAVNLASDSSAFREVRDRLASVIRSQDWAKKYAASLEKKVYSHELDTSRQI